MTTHQIPIVGSVRTAASAAVLAIATARASKGVPDWDAATFRAFNDLPDGLAPIAWAPMQVGALAAPLVVAGALGLRGQRRFAARVAGNGIAVWLLAKQLKASTQRDRPGTTIESTKLRMGSADHGLGFPSGHAAVAAALTRDVTRNASPGIRAVGIGLTVLVGASRIYVGAHYPLDVIGGWALGMAMSDTTDLFPFLGS